MKPAVAQMVLEALKRQLVWHEARKKEFSKSGRSTASTAWERMQHDEEIDELNSNIAVLEAGIAQAVEPVAEVRAKSDAYGGTFVLWKKQPVAGMTLYDTPKEPAAHAPVNAELLEALKDLLACAGGDITEATFQELEDALSDQDADDDVKIQVRAFLKARAVIAKATVCAT